MNRRTLIVGGAALVTLGAGATWLTTARMGSAADYAAATRAVRTALPAQADVGALIRYATLAPNGHNTQPWQFAVAPGSITIRPDFTRRTPVVDPDNHHLFVSLGCAAENLALAAAARGLGGTPMFDSGGDGSITFAHSPSARQASPLCDAIPVRQSTRSDYDGRAVSPGALRTLASAGTSPDVDLVLITDRPMMDRIRDLVVTGNSAQMADAAFIRELKSWLRFNPRRALETADGLYSAASGNPALPDWLGPLAFDWLATTRSQNDSYARQIRSSAGIAVFFGARADPEHWVAVGRACQRFALQATALGLKHAFINQPVEVPALQPELAELVGMAGRRPDVVMRFGFGPLMPYAPRRPMVEVIAA